MASSSSTSYKDLNHILSDPEDEPFPVPMTTRNRIPRSRATSLARSRGSSRASSLSGSRVASVAGSVAGSRPGSRAGMREFGEGSSGSVREGLNWQPGRNMDSLDDELGYFGASSSGSGGPSGSGHWATEDEPPTPAPISSKAKGKKRARSTPDSEIEGHGVARTRPRIGSPQEEQPYTQDFAPTFHDQAYSFHPTTFSFTTQTPVDEPPPTQSTIPSSSSGSLTLASTATLGSSASVLPMAELAIAGSASSTYPPPFSSFDNYDFDFGAMTQPSEGAGSPSATIEPPLVSLKGKVPEMASGSAGGSSAERDTLLEESGGSNGEPSSSSSTQAGSSSSSSAEAPSSSSSAPSAASSSTVVTLPTRPPRPLTPPQPDLLSSYTCPICFFPPSNATLTPCGHICCGSCLFTAIKSSQSRNGMAFAHSTFATHGEALCPVCRAPIPGWDGKGGGVIGLRVRSVISI